ncbi:MAG: carbohydrate kinase family protein [Treponema sp.]|jgi:sugar/nucleoside kinase (ribokinase family)|nr:carbohydrate kinase family protein [Treponema sp.]
MKIHGTGCGIVDCIYINEDFASAPYQAALSKKRGDGGLGLGKLVFSDALEAFAKKPYDEVLGELTGARQPDVMNLGGPSLVALIHAAQSLAVLNTGTKETYQVRYFGVRGNDAAADFFEKKLSLLPLKTTILSKAVPNSRTDALSDPRWENGAGERSFVYRKGASDVFTIDDLGDDFFNADLVVFGGTALTRQIHVRLTDLLKRAKQNAVTMVNLVFDFAGEAAANGKKWKLGAHDDAYQYIDLLVADHEEAVKTSGKAGSEKAAEWFLSQGCGAVVITRGKEPVVFASGPRSCFKKADLSYLPACELVNQELAEDPKRRGDTTGCGDNFAGQLISMLAQALEAKTGPISLRDLVPAAIAAGGFACFYTGGVYYEKQRGEKSALLQKYINAYCKQIGE